MFLDTMVIDAPPASYELEGTTAKLIHLWCGTCGTPTGSAGCRCYYLPQFVSRFKKISLNDYDEQLTNYTTETGYVIAPSDEHDQTPVHNVEPVQNQPQDDVLKWNGNTKDRTLQSSSSITDRFHPEILMNLIICADTAEAMSDNPRMKYCKKCGYQQHYTTTACAYC